MKYTVDKQDKYTLLSLDEENLNSIISPDLKSEFVFLRNEGVKNLILDLTKIDYVDSSGLSSILTANRLWKGYGSFILTGIESANVQKLIDISRLDSILNIRRTIEQAIDFVYMEQIEKELKGEEE